ncbi:MAG: hypothetical protein JNG90_12825, partial [Planctomycetaceae bacterium]|nr:hypothetical protein [Planctomycetaceae bacterium]
MSTNIAAETFARVRSYWEIDDPKAAHRVAEGAVADAPWDGKLWELLGLARQRVGDRCGARQALETANSLVPLSIAGQCALANCYLAEGLREPARVILTHLAACPELPTEHLAELAAGLGRVGELELALRMCRLASQREPDRDEPLYGMAYYMRRLRFPTKMIATVVAQAQRLDPGSMTYRLALALLYAELDRGSDALALVKEVSLETLRCRSCLEKLTRLFD